jgi:alpha-1,6-mannosyltransferase
LNRHRLLLVLGILILLLLAPLAALGDLGVHARSLLVLWLAAHGCYLIAARLVIRRDGRSGPNSSDAGAGPRRLSLGFILAIGLAMRLILIPTEPTLSEDLYRYLWDGRLVAHGLNPYAHAPDDPILTPFRDRLFASLNHPHVPTIYPPAAQFLFGAVARVAATPQAFKVALLPIEAALWIALLALLRRRSLSEERILLLAWSPLVVIESYGSGHLDLVAAALLVIALALLEARRAISAGAAFALAVLTKYTPLLLVFYLARRRQRAMLAVAGAVALFLFFPFAVAGNSLWTGLRTYLAHWDFNGALYPLLRPWIPDDRTVRYLLAGCLAVAGVWISFRARSAAGAAAALWVAYLLTSPTVFPWYVVPLVALAPLCPNAGTLAFSGFVALSYVLLPLYRTSGAWRLPHWVPWVEYGGWGAVALAAWLVSRADRGANGGQARRAAWASESPPT